LLIFLNETDAAWHELIGRWVIVRSFAEWVGDYKDVLFGK